MGGPNPVCYGYCETRYMARLFETKISTWPPTASRNFMCEDTQSTPCQACFSHVLRTVSLSVLMHVRKPAGLTRLQEKCMGEKVMDSFIQC